jgi:hypothetical protein
MTHRGRITPPRTGSASESPLSAITGHSGRALPDAHVREADFLQSVCDLARLHGWRVYHQRPARVQGGWRTALTGDPGWPDVVLARAGAPLWVVELKAQRGQLTDDQRRWIDTLRQATGVRAEVWRPADWSGIERILGKGGSDG